MELCAIPLLFLCRSFFPLFVRVFLFALAVVSAFSGEPLRFDSRSLVPERWLRDCLHEMGPNLCDQNVSFLVSILPVTRQGNAPKDLFGLQDCEV